MIRWRRARRKQQGFTLVEVLIAMSISGALGAVIVAAIITSLNLASSTNTILKDSADTSLISSFLIRDAQAAGGTDPVSAQADPSLGVSTTDWAGCTQTGSLVVRFAWVDHSSVSTKQTVVVTYGLNGTTFVRELCKGTNAPVGATLGRNISTAAASCDTTNCVAANSVTVALVGAGSTAPLHFSLTASLRPLLHAQPTTSTASAVYLLALGDGTTTPCPSLTTTGTSKLNVVGDAVVAGECATNAESLGASTSVTETGSLSAMTGLVDPFAGRSTPSTTCGTGGDATYAGGATMSPGSYGSAVTIDTAVVLDPGQYNFCQGVTFGANAIVSAAGPVSFYVPSGAFQATAGATFTLQAPSSGSTANILVWLPKSNTSAVNVNVGPLVSSLNGFVYAPGSAVTFTSSTATAFDALGVVAKTFANQGSLTTRLGPFTTPTLSPNALTMSADVAFSKTLATNLTGAITWSTASGSWPTGITLGSATGLVSGTPTCWNASPLSVAVTAIDASGLGVSGAITLNVNGNLVLADPGSTLTGTVTLNSALPPECGQATPTATVTFQHYGSAGWTSICSDSSAPYSCSWNTSSLADGYYPIRSITSATSGNLVSNVLTPYVNNHGSTPSSTTTTTSPNSGGSVSALNGGSTSGKLESGDYIQYSFGGTVAPGTILSGWNGTTPATVYLKITAGDVYNNNSAPAPFACQKYACLLVFANASDIYCSSSTLHNWQDPTVGLGALQIASGNGWPDGGQSYWIVQATLSMLTASPYTTVKVTFGSTNPAYGYCDNTGLTTSATYNPNPPFQVQWYDPPSALVPVSGGRATNF
jgi:prepilin-type N-terminal cleavage/methylation domain-containing protein